ncbi:MAG: hypothetical protein ACRD3N_12335 [Terracidiphilus sp.]
MDNFNLHRFTYKEIDKFLYREGGKLPDTSPETEDSEAIAPTTQEG